MQDPWKDAGSAVLGGGIAVKNVLDEREQQIVSRIEHYGLTALEIGLCIEICVELLRGAGFTAVVGESIVLLLVSAGMMASYLYYGLWDTDAKPSLGGNIRYSILSSICIGLVTGGITHKAWLGVCVAAAVAVVMAGILTVLMKMVEARKRQQADLYESENEEESI